MKIKSIFKKAALAACAMLVATSLVACGGEDSSEKIIVGGKDFTEQDILVHLVSEVVEAKTDIEVERKPYLGGSSVVATSIQTGDIDVMVEYTGTGLISVLGKESMNDPQEVYEAVKSGYDEQFGVKWLKPLGFNNTFAITMRREMAEEMGIKTLSDLGKHAKDFTFASTQEFLERNDGYEAIKPVYGIEFKDAKGMDPGLCYTALKEGQVDVSISFATDGRIPAFDFAVLEDDKNFFPPYDASVLVRNDTLEKYPELEEALNSLAGKINDEEMAKMNAQVDIDQKAAETVAKDWLVENGIIEG